MTYYIHAPRKFIDFSMNIQVTESKSDPFDLSNKLLLIRALSLQTGTRVQAFRDALRLRDRRCVITGEGISMIVGGVARLRTSSHWLMSSTRLTRIRLLGFRHWRNYQLCK